MVLVIPLALLTSLRLSGMQPQGERQGQGQNWPAMEEAATAAALMQAEQQGLEAPPAVLEETNGNGVEEEEKHLMERFRRAQIPNSALTGEGRSFRDEFLSGFHPSSYLAGSGGHFLRPPSAQQQRHRRGGSMTTQARTSRQSPSDTQILRKLVAGKNPWSRRRHYISKKSEGGAAAGGSQEEI